MGAISSSGTNSGRNLAGVIHGSLSFTGSKVTITSPFSEEKNINEVVKSIYQCRKCVDLAKKKWQ